MTDSNKKNEELEDEIKADSAKGTEEDTPSTDELLKKIEELEAAIKEKDDRYLRLAAEYDNFRRRSREEKEAIYTDALSDTVGELLPIIDNLDRAALYEDGEQVKSGLAMIAKSVDSVFEKLGIEAIGNVGDTFDPNLHNAVMHIDDESLEENTVSQVFQKGFKLGEKVIRFAMVQVAN